MPQTQSAKKALRVSARKRIVNDRWRKKLRQSLHAIRDAITAKDKKAAQAAYFKTQSVLDRAARRHIIPKNKAARQKSRLNRAITQIK